jgi:DMSO reductase anchor subunit
MMSRMTFKYNLSFYYQSTIVYFAVFLLYLVIRGQFLEDAFQVRVKNDPLLYFLAIILLVSLVSLIYNIYKNKRLEINDSTITFIHRFRKKVIDASDLKSIRFFKDKRDKEKNAFRLVSFSLKTRRRPVIFRPYNYENEPALVKALQDFKEKNNL